MDVNSNASAAQSVVSTSFAGDSGIPSANAVHELPMPSNIQNFTGNPVDRQMNKSFKTQQGSPYAGSTSGSSTYGK